MTPPPGPAELRGALRSGGIRLKRRWGQNFLIKTEHLAYMTEAAEVGPGDVVLEIGSGPGCLTTSILDRGAFVLGVEIDAQLMEIGRTLLEKRFSAGVLERLLLLRADFLKGKNRIAPHVIQVLEALLHERKAEAFKVVSNLPYSIATPAVMNLLTGPWPWSRMVVTVQEEVAGRFLAGPGDSAYGRVSVLTAAFARAGRLKRLRPGCFWPKPEVDSAILRLDPLSEPKLDKGEGLRRFDAVLRALFAHRRKTWLKSLALQRKTIDAAAVAAKAEEKGIAPGARAQDLCLDDMLEILRIVDPD